MALLFLFKGRSLASGFDFHPANNAASSNTDFDDEFNSDYPPPPKICKDGYLTYLCFSPSLWRPKLKIDHSGISYNPGPTMPNSCTPLQQGHLTPAGRIAQRSSVLDSKLSTALVTALIPQPVPVDGRLPHVRSKPETDKQPTKAHPFVHRENKSQTCLHPTNS